MTRKLIALVFFALSFFSRPARAEEPVVVAVLVSPSASDGLAARVEAELGSLGFRAKQVPIADDADARSLEAAARTSGAAAAIRVVRSDERAEVWVADRVTGKTLLRTVTCEPGEDTNGVLAVRAVELLRASLLEIEATHPPRGEVRVTETVRRVVAAAHPRPSPPPFAVGVGFGPLIVPSLSPSLEALISFAWMPSRLGIEIFGAIPVTSSQVCDALGCAFVSVTTLGGGVRWVLTSLEARVQPILGLGFAGLIAHADGQAKAPFGSARTDAGAAAAYALVGLDVAIARNFLLGLDVRVGSALPPIPIRFAGADVAHWGAPYVSTALRGAVAFP